MLAIHNQRHSYRNDQPLTVWLYAIARYKLIDTLRARLAHGAVMVPFNDDDEDSAIAATPKPQAEETRRDLLVLLQTLRDRYRPTPGKTLFGWAVTAQQICAAFKDRFKRSRAPCSAVFRMPWGRKKGV